MSGLGFVLLVFGMALLSFGAEGVGEERIRARMERRPPQTGGWYAVDGPTQGVRVAYGNAARIVEDLAGGAA